MSGISTLASKSANWRTPSTPKASSEDVMYRNSMRTTHLWTIIVTDLKMIWMILQKYVLLQENMSATDLLKITPADLLKMIRTMLTQITTIHQDSLSATYPKNIGADLKMIRTVLLMKRAKALERALTHEIERIGRIRPKLGLNQSMWEEGGYEVIKKAILNVSLRHKDHISAYGEGNERRLEDDILKGNSSTERKGSAINNWDLQEMGTSDISEGTDQRHITQDQDQGMAEDAHIRTQPQLVIECDDATEDASVSSDIQSCSSNDQSDESDAGETWESENGQLEEMSPLAGSIDKPKPRRRTTRKKIIECLRSPYSRICVCLRVSSKFYLLLSGLVGIGTISDRPPRFYVCVTESMAGRYMAPPSCGRLYRFKS